MMLAMMVVVLLGLPTTYAANRVRIGLSSFTPINAAILDRR
jgi:hypothetical protein